MYINNKNIQFDGWIKKQLICQSNSLFGHLDKIWKDVRDSKWLGGKEEGWERFPYYLNGLIPLAFALKDKNLIDKANRYIDIIISCQKDNGNGDSSDDQPDYTTIETPNLKFENGAYVVNLPSSIVSIENYAFTYI